ncbi:ATP-binding domain-containing protein [Oscillatoria sp. FACHB-1406]|nr:ATP-binding domain-containing protein [Oscillatoria sp. FACHB-1406]
MDDRAMKFVITETQELDGGQQQVWEAVKTSFSDRDCIVYWRYPLFSKVGEQRKEPDIVIVDREWGIVAIEICAAAIAQITQINEAGDWEFSADFPFSGQPYPLAEHHLRAIIGLCDRDPSLWRKVTGRALIVLPSIPEAQWQERGFHQHPHSPPILFQDRFDTLPDLIKHLDPLVPGEGLNDEQWTKLLIAVSGTSILKKSSQPRIASSNKNRAAVVELLREHLYELDLKQEHIGKEIAPGVQRIRGIAGSGKTVLLCQKAAHMHLKHPDWDIALVFFTRSLYDQIISLIDRWVRRFSNGELSYDPQTNPKLRVLHAWGASNRPGLYSTLCKTLNVRRKTVNDTTHKQPTRSLAEFCKWLLEEREIEPVFDAILIDEGQDLVTNNDLKYLDKQAIYWLAYQALRPVDREHPEQRRLVWAYDEAQSLDSLQIPTAKELFGEEFGDLLSKGNYPGGIKKSEVMRRCYRTPGTILMAAHAIGMGLLRPQGMLAGITQKDGWEKLGYEVTGSFQKVGQKIVISRPQENSPNCIEELWEEPVFEFTAYDSRSQELEALAQKISSNIGDDGLKPSREILVVVLGASEEAVELETKVAQFLIDRGLKVYVPTALELDRINPKHPDNDPDRFWMEGGVTVSRISRAKGNEADLVYVVGCDRVARTESDLALRNQLFVALTRSRGWVNLSGVGNYPLYEEINQVLAMGSTITFTYQRPLQRDLDRD